MRKLFSLFIPLALSKTARNTYVVFLGNGLSAFFSFIFTVSVVRVMSLADFGYFSAILSLILLVSDIADLGLGSSMSAFLPPLAKEKRRLLSFLKTAFVAQGVIVIIITVLLLISSPILTEYLFHIQDLLWLVEIGIIGTVFALFAQFFQYALSAQQKFFQVGFLSAFGSLLRIIFLLILIFFLEVNLQTVAWLHVMTFLVIGAIGFLFVKPDFLRIKREAGDMIKLLKFSSLLGIARGLTALASRLDVLMLVSLAGPTEAGIYSIASRVISIYPLLAGSFSTVIAPKITTIFDKEELKKFIYKTGFGTFAIVCSIIILILIAEPIMVILFTEKARPAVAVFRLLLLSMIFFVGSIPPVSVSIYHLKKPVILAINSVLQIIIVVIGNLYFIPRFGRLGPAYSLILAYGITLFITSLFSLIYFRKKHAI